jgi:hypothetical protein
MENLFGGLLEFVSKEQLENFINTMDKTSALKMIELSLLHAQHRGLFSFEESTIIYNSLNKLKENAEKSVG